MSQCHVNVKLLVVCLLAALIVNAQSVARAAEDRLESEARKVRIRLELDDDAKSEAQLRALEDEMLEQINQTSVDGGTEDLVRRLQRVMAEKSLLGESAKNKKVIVIARAERDERPSDNEIELRVKSAKQRIVELHEAGKHDQAQSIERELDQWLNKIKAERGTPDRPSKPNVEQRIKHLRNAAEYLHAAGYPDKAKEVLAESERLQRHAHRERHEPRSDRHLEELNQRMLRIAQSVETLQGELAETQRAMEREIQKIHEGVEREISQIHRAVEQLNEQIER